MAVEGSARRHAPRDSSTGKLHLSGRGGDRAQARRRAAFRSRRRRWNEDTEVTGPIVLNSGSRARTEDMDIFATLRNIGPDGKDVCEIGQQGEPVACVTKGWLRASHRKLDPAEVAAVPAVSCARRAPVAQARRDRRMPGRNLADQHGVHERPQDPARHRAARRRRQLALHALSRRLQQGAENTIYAGGDRESYLLLPIIPVKK